MAGWSPPSPSQRVVAGVAIAYAVVLADMILIWGTILLGVVVGLVLVVAYFLWRLLVAVEAVADGVHRIAAERDRN